MFVDVFGEQVKFFNYAHLTFDNMLITEINNHTMFGNVKMVYHRKKANWTSQCV